MAVIRTITIEPGTNTGWHYHPGPVQAVLLSGTLHRLLEDGTVEITRPGQFLVEQADQVHIGYNHGDGPVVILANYQVAEGCPLWVPAPAPELDLTGLDLTGLDLSGWDLTGLEPTGSPVPSQCGHGEAADLVGQAGKPS
ncbi:cupin domain-containing protein [Kitasatospora sp. NPDC052896]|uniref:cupin domain-containing protein n=1 Tax=Kitasatospora sp. NPDC052896 TaxID=3364061 RepID=UPI0037C8282B